MSWSEMNQCAPFLQCISFHITSTTFARSGHVAAILRLHVYCHMYLRPNNSEMQHETQKRRNMVLYSAFDTSYMLNFRLLESHMPIFSLYK